MTFDLDGVLMENPFKTGIFPEVSDVLAQDNGNVSRNNNMFAFERKKLEIQKRIYESSFTSILNDNFVESLDWDYHINKIAQEYDFKGSISVVSMVEKYCNRIGYIYAYPGSREILRSLPENFWLAILSNGYKKYQLPVVKKLNIIQHFDYVADVEEYGCIKPSSKIFKATLKEFKAVFGEIEKTRKIHVGDKLLDDLFGGNQANFLTIWVNTKLPNQISCMSPNIRTESEEFHDYFKDLFKMKFSSFWKEKFGLKLYGDCYPDYAIKNLYELIDVIEDIMNLQ